MFSAAKKVFGNSNLTKVGYPEDYDPIENQDYVDVLYEKFSDIIDYRDKVCKCEISMSNVIFAIDCKRHEIWRKDLAPNYKGKRDDKTPMFNTQPSKDYITNVVVPLYVAQGAIALQIPRTEADDIIGIIVQNNRDVDMHHVIASDKDLLQLTGKNYRQYDANGTIIPKVSLFKDVAKSSRFKDRDFSKEIVDLDAKDMIFFKTLMGDKSDCIDPIHKGCGPVKAYNYLRDKKLLGEAVRNIPNTMETLQLNTKLMNFKFIPPHIVEEIKYKYSKERINQ
jgi:5'-3' exonuclease